MIKIEITIPLNYNDGKKIKQKKLDYIRDYILSKFGGLTITSNQAGYWVSKNKIYTDLVRTYIIVTESTKQNIKWIEDLKQLLKTELKQEDIFIIKSEVKLI